MSGTRTWSLMACWLGAGVGIAVAGIAGWPLRGRTALGPPPDGFPEGVEVSDVGATAGEVFARALSGYVEPIAWLGLILILLGVLSILVTSSLEAQRAEPELRVARAVGASRADLRREAVRRASPLRRGTLLLAGCAGIGVATLVIARETLPPALSLVGPVGPRFRLALFGVAAMAACALAAPHLRAARRARSLAPGRQFGRGAGASAVVLQIAVSVGLLYAAGVLWRSVSTAPAVIATRQPADTLVAPLRAAECPGGDCGSALAALVSRLDSGGPGDPRGGGASAWASAGSVLGLGSEEVWFSDCNGCFVSGLPVPHLHAVGRLHGVSPRYFEVARHSLLRGRAWTPEESAAGRVAILSERLARELFQATDPIGQTLTRAADRYAPPEERFEVIGVVADHWPGGIATSSSRTGALYLPVGAVSARSFDAIFAAGGASARDATAIAATRLEDLLTAERRGPERLASVLAVLAGLALLIAAVGIASAVRLRIQAVRDEIAIRRAVGASRFDIRRWVLADTLRLVALGGVGASMIGWGWASALAELHRSVDALQPGILLGVAAASTLAALVAALPAAGVAARVDPARNLE